jgi:S1-C subfamily serine protease
MNERLSSGFLLDAVASFDPMPRIEGPRPEVAEPELPGQNGVGAENGVEDAARSVVQVFAIGGSGYGYGSSGSGWVAAPDLVVTNAHVVAGEVLTRVETGDDGPRKRAEVILFDAKNDIAILRVRDLQLPTLPLAEPEFGEPVAVLGFPENGPLDARPGRTGATRRVISTDAYNDGPVERTVTNFRVYVRPGNSGGPVVNGDGEVVATIFASRADSHNAGYGIPSQIIQEHLQLAASRKAPVDTGRCAN